MVFSPFPPPVPSLPLVLAEVSATGSLRKMGRRHSFFGTSIADPDTAALLKDMEPGYASTFSPLCATTDLAAAPCKFGRVMRPGARVAMRGALA
jgi:hypothetical protein